MSDKVSIIVPVYNAEKTIARCVDSITKQSYKELEIILVDDGSTDQSAKIINDYAKQDDRIISITIPNGGVSNARNRGLGTATGRFVQFVDADDYLEPCMTERMVSMMLASDVEWLANGYLMHIGGKVDLHVYINRVFTSHAAITDAIPVMYREGILNTLWNKLYVRKLIHEKFNPNIVVGEDLIFNLDYLKGIDSLRIDESAYYHYIAVVSQKNLSSKYHKEAATYLNLQFAKLLHMTELSDCEEKKTLPDMYIREFLRILRKASNAHISKKELCIVINTASEFCTKHIDGYKNNKVQYKILRRLVEQKRYTFLFFFGRIMNMTFHIIHR